MSDLVKKLHREASLQGMLPIIQSIETGLGSLVTNPAAKGVLGLFEGLLNSVLAEQKAEFATAHADLQTAAAGLGSIGQALVMMLVNLITNLEGNPVLVQSLIDWFKGLLGGLVPAPAPAPAKSKKEETKA